MESQSIFEQHESQVRSYCRDIPVVFHRASGHLLFDERGRSYIDFLAGAGALNYGHNNPELKQAVIEYMHADGVTHSLDLYTGAKRSFICEFQQTILAPRHLDYRMQFTGPTGANAVEAALKLARRATSRTNVVSFTNSFHGMSLGALGASSARRKRSGAGLPFVGVDRFPFDGYLGPHVDTLAYLDEALSDPGSGIDAPAAFIVETLQAEGGLNEARINWLRGLQEVARRHGALLIVDEIQTGCGRTGPFFSFERAGLYPDVVCMAKSIGGLGLPMALVLIRPEHDVWEPGQHNGTFRGNNLAFVAGAQALRLWREPAFERAIARKGELMRERLQRIAHATRGEVRGLGMLQGVAWSDREFARSVARRALADGVIVETCGAWDQVLKIMPPLTIPEQALCDGLDRVLRAALAEIEAAQLDVAV
ncbi:diaminobutyrate--2-oxoglutarate transaminase [Bradyrhizobium sp. CB82]|uniref:diaminobutyrate--2-oxoglutarate transaminase n=1 Tax=Bradyrhizobium sp. CB82 TaxID=3039159 RepID=UPI0024B1E301|nr:diaminobutyrate--2-oxoglutarate transaminase [Bradyrhizobium sp. CB82]WFU43353.1 diaminobutyrate--2-oxoglutarate transaminase [Bradyrhizobium sp. CB82]